MRIEWYGHASFKITSDDGTVIITDPYESGSYNGAIGYKPINDLAHIVTVSHQHADHNSIKEVNGSPEIIDSIGEHEIKGFSINGIPSFHDDEKGCQRGENIIFKIGIDGIDLVHLGDLGHLLDKETVEKIGKCNILFIPVGGTFTIDSEVAKTVIEEINPGIVMPMHFKNECIGFDLDGVDRFLSGQENIKRLPEFEIRKKEMDEIREREIIILEHKR